MSGGPVKSLRHPNAKDVGCKYRDRNPRKVHSLPLFQQKGQTINNSGAFATFRVGLKFLTNNPYVLTVCVRVCLCIRAHVWRSESDLGCQSSPSTFLVKSLFLPAVAYSRLAVPEAPRHISHPSHLALCTGITDALPHPPTCGFRGFKPSPHACVASSLPTEPSPEPRINPLILSGGSKGRNGMGSGRPCNLYIF